VDHDLRVTGGQCAECPTEESGPCDERWRIQLTKIAFGLGEVEQPTSRMGYLLDGCLGERNITLGLDHPQLKTRSRRHLARNEDFFEYIAVL
jgi:hypothetical protein